MTEDLNLERMKLRIISRCWYDMDKFPTVSRIAKVTGVSSRTLNRFAKDYNLPKRTKTNIQKHITKHFIDLLPS